MGRLGASIGCRRRRAPGVRPALLALVVAARLLLGSASARAAAPEISLLTMGPGDSLVTMFGHSALLVERAGSPALVFNFGMYTEDSITVPRILSGRLRYFLFVDTLPRTLAQYRGEGRTILVQHLALPSPEAEQLARALAVNARPENAAYHYDFAFDNCTTRARDALDRALGGALRRALTGASGQSFRDHALRLTADHPLYFLAFDLALGSPADRPLGRWDDAYLPDTLAALLRGVSVAGGPLVSREGVLYLGERAPREHAPVRAPLYALFGLAFGGLAVWLGWRPGRPARWAFAAFASALGLKTGLVGLWLLVLLVTDVNGATHGNVNLLFSPPWALALIVPAVRAARGRAASLRSLERVARLLLAGALLALLLLPIVHQDGYRVSFLFVPLWLGSWVAARARCRAAAQAAAASLNPA